MCKMEKLPMEVLEKVFEVLPRKDRKSGVLVSSLWRKVGERPRLWAWVRLPRVYDQNIRAKVIEMLSFKRLARVERIIIQPNAAAVSENLLQAMIQHTGLKRVHMWTDELPAGLDSELVLEALTRVEELWLGFDSLPIHLLIALLTEVSQVWIGLVLVTLRLYRTNLAKVPPALVASGLTRLVTVDLYCTRLTSHQVAALMVGVNRGNSSIKKLSFDGSLEEEEERIGPLNLQPLVKLEELILYNRITSLENFNNFLTRQELVNFFAALSKSTKLRKLLMDRLSWPAEEVMDGSTGVVARAINFLEEVGMTAPPYQVNNLQSSSHEV